MLCVVGLTAAGQLLQKPASRFGPHLLWGPVRRVFNSSIVLFALALVARFKVLTELLPAHAWSSFYRYNEPSHIAWALASGLGFSAPWPHTIIAPTAQQPPLYPLLVACIFKLAGIYSSLSLWLILGLNAVISACTAILILRVGRREFDELTAVLAAWVWSCWVYEATVSIRLWESSLAALLLMFGILLFEQMARTQNLRPWLLFGLLTGAAAVTNTTLLSVLPVFWLCLWMIYRKRGVSCSRVLLLSLSACVLVLLPWTIRNYEVFHTLIPVRDNFGLELWVGIEVGPTPNPVVPRPFPLDFPLSDPREYNRLGELPFMQSRSRMALGFIRNYPGDYLSLVAVRSIRYWSEPRGTPWPLISALAWIGAILALRKKAVNALPYVIVLLLFPLVYYLTHTFPTYRHPIEPVIFLLAAYAVTRALAGIAAMLSVAMANRSA